MYFNIIYDINLVLECVDSSPSSSNLRLCSSVSGWRYNKYTDFKSNKYKLQFTVFSNPFHKKIEIPTFYGNCVVRGILPYKKYIELIKDDVEKFFNEQIMKKEEKYGFL